MSVTIKQIAERTGLSVSTVGNVVSKASARYSEITRQKVFEAVKEMGYRPNSSARAIRNGRSGCAALVLSRGQQEALSYMPAGLLDGLDEALSQHNMHLSVSRLSDEELTSDDFAPKVLREFVADGMIVNYTHEIPPRMLELINAHHTPAVWINAKLPRDAVYPNDALAAERATALLIARGHRRIALVSLKPRGLFYGCPFEEASRRFHYSVADRFEGYRRAMRAAGLTPQCAYDDRFVEASDSVPAAIEVLRSPDRPTALLLYSQYEAPAVLLAASKLKLSIPDDLVIVNFAPRSDWIAGVHIPAVLIPTVEIGRRAVNMLLRKIEAPNQPCESEAVPYELPEGDVEPCRAR
jgi:LacI family transcriptional regulator